MEAVAVALVQGLIALAPHLPGLLAKLFGKQTDEEAKTHALAVVGGLRVIDVDGIVDAHRKPAASEVYVNGRLLGHAVRTLDYGQALALAGIEGDPSGVSVTWRTPTRQGSLSHDSAPVTFEPGRLVINAMRTGNA